MTMASTRDEFANGVLAVPKVKKALDGARLEGKRFLTQAKRSLEKLMDFEDEAIEFKTMVVKGSKISFAEELAFVRSAHRAELAYRKLNGALLAWLQANAQTLNPLIRELRRRTDETLLFAHPAFMDVEFAEELSDTGIDLDQQTALYEDVVFGEYQSCAETLASLSFRSLLAEVASQAKDGRYIEGPYHLVRRGYITFSGAGRRGKKRRARRRERRQKRWARRPKWLNRMAGTIKVGAGAAVFGFGVYRGGAMTLGGLASGNNLMAAAGAAVVVVSASAGTRIVRRGLEQIDFDAEPEPKIIAENYNSLAAPEGRGPGPSKVVAGLTVNPPVSTRRTKPKHYLGNMSRTKRELHSTDCAFLHLIDSQHLRRFGSLASARKSGLDNCHYCLGESKR